MTVGAILATTLIVFEVVVLFAAAWAIFRTQAMKQTAEVWRENAEAYREKTEALTTDMAEVKTRLGHLENENKILRDLNSRVADIAHLETIISDGFTRLLDAMKRT